MPVLKQFSFSAPGARRAWLGVSVALIVALPASLAMARAEAPPVGEQEQQETDAPPPDQVLSTRDDDGDVGPEGELDNPTGRVARLSFTQGNVSLLSSDGNAKEPAVLNRPIAPGDEFTTAGDGRAEVELGGAAVRLGNDSAFKFIALEDRALRMRLSSGIANLRVRELGENDLVEVETPQAVMSILRPGNYRLEVNPSGEATIVKVSGGALEARGSVGQSFVVRAQQVATLTGTSRLAMSTSTLGAPDSFDEWTLERDQRMDRAQTAAASKYVPEDVVGYEDLDNYGSWRNDPEYGYVWSPTTVVAGWTPYRYGRYSYVSGWGWTWIDDAPWGFAPFHYGSWVTIGGRWNWVPGPRHGRYTGRPGYGGNYGGNHWNRPGRPSDWHVPRPPRDSTGHNTPPLGLDSPRNGYRYLRPVTPSTSISQPGSVSPTQPNPNDRRMRIPRYERQNPSTSPRNEGTFPRNNNGRYAQPVAPPPRMERPREMPQPQMRPAPQSQPAARPNPNVNSGGRFDRGTTPGNGGRVR
jgi:hypothetical protein